jgi:hypothetical protein
MPSNNVFHWPDGRGWLVFSGGVDDDIRATALGRTAADGGIAYVPMGGDLDSAERMLEDMLDLGAPSGYLVDVNSEDDATITAKLSDAGMVIIEAADDAVEARSVLLGAAIEGIQEAYQNGAIVLVEGASVMAFGAWIVANDGKLVVGLDWLEASLIAPGVTSAAAWARDILLSQPLAFAVGIGVGSALALGPDGQVETWGSREVTVALGRNFKMHTGEQSSNDGNDSGGGAVGR